MPAFYLWGLAGRLCLGGAAGEGCNGAGGEDHTEEGDCYEKVMHRGRFSCFFGERLPS
ncbi:hypothetical protein SAMN05444167_3859 [Terriglobus roseus]|uniref:Uncharacterized protein n=1 Tax=Terriglobus roseus TaxID=392734 RepID=A0A1G7QFZ4_9BACT|nr:hypothetical protein SAMN05444167_3859 [Terriglobus roseus]